jgi:hypothetical protein
VCPQRRDAADRQLRGDDHERAVGQRREQLPHAAQDPFDVGVVLVVDRRVEGHPRPHGARQLPCLGREAQARGVTLEQLGEARLGHRRASRGEVRDDRRVGVHGDDLVARLGQAGGRHASQVPEADHSDRAAHAALLA